jgi:guanylate kinase
LSEKFLHPKPEPLLIVISGPSGAGKDAVIQRLKENRQPFYFVVTATDRKPRDNEVPGADYVFVSREAFEEMIRKDELLEYALVYGQYKGIPRSQVQQALASGMDVIMRVDVQGAAKIRKLCPEALLIFISVEDEQDLARRIQLRGSESEEQVNKRLKAAQVEFDQLDLFDYVVVNHYNHLNETVEKIQAIITAEHHRTRQRRVNL